jgi:transcription elongation factor S-II
MLAPSLVLRRAIEIENAAFVNNGNTTSTEYKNKLRSLYQNLKHKSNPQLRVRVLSAEISAERLVVMTHKELASPERRAEDEKMQQENMNKAMVAQGEKSISTALRCPKCGQKKVSYSQAQTRSADEPMTTFCECTVCGNRWKVSSWLVRSLSCAYCALTDLQVFLKNSLWLFPKSFLLWRRVLLFIDKNNTS